MLATLFHASAAITLFLYPLIVSKKIISRISSVILFLIITINLNSIIIKASNLPFFNHFITYADAVTIGGSNNYSFIIYLLLSIVFIFFMNKFNKINPKNNIYITLFILGTILTFSGFYNPFVKRISLFFLITEVFLLPQIVDLVKSQKDKRLITLLIILLVIVKFSISTYLLNQASLIPYRIN